MLKIIFICSALSSACAWSLFDEYLDTLQFTAHALAIKVVGEFQEDLPEVQDFHESFDLNHDGIVTVADVSFLSGNLDRTLLGNPKRPKRIDASVSGHFTVNLTDIKITYDVHFDFGNYFRRSASCVITLSHASFDVFRKTDVNADEEEIKLSGINSGTMKIKFTPDNEIRNVIAHELEQSSAFRKSIESIVGRKAHTFDGQKVPRELKMKDFNHFINVTNNGIVTTGNIKFHSGLAHFEQIDSLDEETIFNWISIVESSVYLPIELKNVSFVFDTKYDLKNYSKTAGDCVIVFPKLRFDFNVTEKLSFTAMRIEAKINIFGLDNRTAFSFTPDDDLTQFVTSQIVQSSSFREKMGHAFENWNIRLQAALNKTAKQFENDLSAIFN